jgi:hypothetical protein
MLPNRADFYVPVLAAWRCGAAVSLVDPLQQPGQKFQPAEISAGWAEKNVKLDKTLAEFSENFLTAQKSLSFQFHCSEFHSTGQLSVTLVRPINV